MTVGKLLLLSAGGVIFAAAALGALATGAVRIQLSSDSAAPNCHIWDGENDGVLLNTVLMCDPKESPRAFANEASDLPPEAAFWVLGRSDAESGTRGVAVLGTTPLHGGDRVAIVGAVDPGAQFILGAQTWLGEARYVVSGLRIGRGRYAVVRVDTFPSVGTSVAYHRLRPGCATVQARVKEDPLHPNLRHWTLPPRAVAAAERCFG
jgi:hypothetical protein